VLRDRGNRSSFDFEIGVLDGIHVTGHFALSVSKEEKMNDRIYVANMACRLGTCNWASYTSQEDINRSSKSRSPAQRKHTCKN
jgi:hypothetical protein